MKNPNLYENLEEAQRRLLGTIVLYDSEPYNILTITNHKGDGIFRMYLWPCKERIKPFYNTGEYPRHDNYPNGSVEQAAYLDKWMEEHKGTPLLRKQANSPLFNRFRPFPLGFINKEGRALYLERAPERRTQQGLMRAMVDVTYPDLSEKSTRAYGDELTGPDFYDCVKGTHPSAKECIENLADPAVQNTSVAFHRHFAFIRGPLDTTFLSYKGDVVGVLPQPNSLRIELPKKYSYLKETVQETGQFESVTIRP